MRKKDASSMRMQAYSLLKLADAIEEASSSRKVQEARSPGNEKELTNAFNFLRALEEEQRSILGLVRSSLSECSTDREPINEATATAQEAEKELTNTSNFLWALDDQQRNILGLAGSSVSASLPDPDPIKGATAKAQEAEGSVSENKLSNTSHFFLEPEDGQKGTLRLVTSSLSECSRASSDSSEIPFDERSQSVASLASGDRFRSLAREVDTRDDVTGCLTERHPGESEDRLESSSYSFHLPYSVAKRAELSRSLGPYLYSKIHSSQDRPLSPYMSICRSSSFCEPAAEAIDVGDHEPDQSDQVRPVSVVPVVDQSASDDSDDTIGRLREFAEATINTVDHSSGSFTDGTHMCTAITPVNSFSVEKKGIASSSVEEGSDQLSSPLDSKKARLASSKSQSVDSDDQDGISAASVSSIDGRPPPCHKSQSVDFDDQGSLSLRSISSSDGRPPTYSKSQSADSDDQVSLSSGSISSIDGRPPKAPRLDSKPAPMSRPPKASRNHLQKQGYNFWGNEKDSKRSANHMSQAWQDLSACQIPLSSETSETSPAWKGSKSKQLPSQKEPQKPFKGSGVNSLFKTNKPCSKEALEQPETSKTDKTPELVVQAPLQWESQQPNEVNLCGNFTASWAGIRCQPKPQNDSKVGSLPNGTGITPHVRNQVGAKKDRIHDTHEHQSNIPKPVHPEELNCLKTLSEQQSFERSREVPGAREQGRQMHGCIMQIDEEISRKAFKLPRQNDHIFAPAANPKDNNVESQQPNEVILGDSFTSSWVGILHQPKPQNNGKVDGLPNGTAITPRTGNQVWAKKDGIQDTHEHQSNIPTPVNPEELDCLNTLSEQQSFERPQEATGTREQGRQMHDCIKRNEEEIVSKALKLPRQDDRIFAPAATPKENNVKDNKEPETLRKQDSCFSSSTPLSCEDIRVDTTVKNPVPQQVLERTGNSAAQVTVVEEHPEPISLGEDSVVAKPVQPGVDKMQPADNETMLRECFSAIVSLRETSESKYLALESKYLELKGSFSQRAMHNHHLNDESHLKETNELLESNQRGMQRAIAKLEAENRRLLDKATAIQLQHEALKLSFLQLELENSELKESATEREHKYLELKDHKYHLEEANQRLMSDIELSRQRESQCQNIEKLFLDLQKGFSNLEEESINLKNENGDLHSKVQVLEAKQQQLGESNAPGSQTDQDLALQSKCHILEELNRQLESENRQVHKEKQKVQSKLLAMEASCLVKEDSNEQLKSRISILLQEKHELQAKLKLIESKCKELDETNSQMESEMRVRDDEGHTSQAKLQEFESNYGELEESSNALKSQAFDLQNEILDLQARLLHTSHSKIQMQCIEPKSLEAETASEYLAVQKLELGEMKEEFETKIHAIASKCIELEQSNCILKVQNLKLTDVNESLKAMKTNLEDSLQEARNEIKDLSFLTHSKNRMERSQEIGSTIENFQEPELKHCAWISSESELSADNGKSKAPQHNMTYEVISCQDLHTYGLNPSSIRNEMQQPSRQIERSKSSPRNGRNGMVKVNFREQTSDDDLSSKLNHLTSTIKHYGENRKLTGVQEEGPSECLNYKEQDLQSVSSEETLHVDTVSSTGNNGMNSQPSGGKHLSRRGKRHRTVTPLSQRHPLSPRPPLPPTVPSTPRQSHRKEAEQPLHNRCDEANDQQPSLSSDSGSLINNREGLGRDEPFSLHRKAKRENTPASILQELLHEPNSDNDNCGSEGYIMGVKAAIDSPPPSHQQSRLPLKSEKRYQNPDASISPDHHVSRRSRKTRSYHHQELSSNKQSSSSHAGAILCGSDEDRKGSRESGYATASPVELVQFGAMIVQKTEANLLMPNFVGAQGPRSSFRQKYQANRKVTSHSSICCEEEGMSVVTEASEDTGDLLNSPSRKARTGNTQMDKPVVRRTASRQTKNPCDWLMPLDFDSPRTPPEDFAAAAKQKFGIDCDASPCGVNAIIPKSCSSVLARRTWNYGKKQSRVTSSSHHLMIGDSGQSSIVSVTTIPTGTSNTILAGAGTGTVTTTRQGGNNSFESHNTNNSDNGANISSKFQESSILAKRGKFRRKQGLNRVRSLSSISSSHSGEKDELKEDKKISLGSPTGGGILRDQKR